MVNNVCNLRCPYCFAGEFVNNSSNEMTLDSFSVALNFILGGETTGLVGIIGGEPMLYSHINEAVRIALGDSRAVYVLLFTNAVLLERLEPGILAHPKLRLLVNCNSPEDMGEAVFERMRRNLTRFNNECGGEGRFTLSVNIYKPDFDYSYLYPILDCFVFDVVRLSISVPRDGELFGKTPLVYFRAMKPAAIRFVDDMQGRGILTRFDCNFIPECVFTPAERERLLRIKKEKRDLLSMKYKLSDLIYERRDFTALLVDNDEPNE